MPVLESSSSVRKYLGIDPGQSGGFALIVESASSTVAYYCPMPETERDIWEKLSQMADGAVCFIEKVHSMPKQGVSSTFKFGQGLGFLRGCLTALLATEHLLSLSEVTPQAWQKFHAIPSRKIKKGETPKAFKDRLRAVAQQKFPSLPIWSEPKSKGRQLAICDALLIAEYCRVRNKSTRY